jgi:hypothetical protein
MVKYTSGSMVKYTSGSMVKYTSGSVVKYTSGSLVKYTSGSVVKYANGSIMRVISDFRIMRLLVFVTSFSQMPFKFRHEAHANMPYVLVFVIGIVGSLPMNIFTAFSTVNLRIETCFTI